MNSTDTLPPADPPPPATGPLVTGPAIVGITLNWWLYGILLMQYYLYFNNGRQDNKVLRAIVHWLLLLDTIQSILTMVDAFHWFVYHFGNYTTLAFFEVAAIDSPFMDALIAFTVQLVYCWRVWVLGKWRVIPAIAAFLALVACVNGMFVGINNVVIHGLLSVNPLLVVPLYLWCFSSAVTDIIIASSMTYLLLKYKRENTGRRTASLIKRILVLILETNAVTAAVAVTLSVVFIAGTIKPPKSTLYLTLGYVLGKLYSNCFMVLLNQRLVYEGSSRGHTLTEDLGTYEPRKRQHTGVTISTHTDAGNQTVVGRADNDFENDISVIQFSELATIEMTKIKASETKKGSRDLV